MSQLFQFHMIGLPEERIAVLRCVIEDSRYTAIQVNGEANLTVNSSSISAGYRAIRVSSWSKHGEEIWIPGSRVERSNVSVIVENTEIHATHYAVECSGRALDCRVANSRLAQFISCRNVRSCTVQHCTINSPPHSHALSMSADDVQTVIIDGNIITNKTMGQAFYASRCQSVQVTFLLFVFSFQLNIYLFISSFTFRTTKIRMRNNFCIMYNTFYLSNYHLRLIDKDCFSESGKKFYFVYCEATPGLDSGSNLFTELLRFFSFSTFIFKLNRNTQMLLNY